jgi:hypothetical protein
MRQGQSDRAIAKTKLMGRLKSVRRKVQQISDTGGQRLPVFWSFRQEKQLRSISEKGRPLPIYLLDERRKPGSLS